jgi:hypothetical protein
MKTRTIGIIGALLIAGALLLAVAGTALAQQPGPYGGWGWGHGGMMGGYGGGQGMMGGYHGGPGMMGGWGGSQAPATATDLTLEGAQEAVERYLANNGAGNLAVKEVMEFEYNFYAIVGEPGAERNAMELLVDRRTGYVHPEPGPNMMWNTEYGHMRGVGGMMGSWWGQPSGEQITEAQAEDLAQEWLDRYAPGSTAGHADAFPGYYTLHTERGGQVTGMLSVHNGTGQVWYHSWHGDFIAAVETGA